MEISVENLSVDIRTSTQTKSSVPVANELMNSLTDKK